jgi:hypothetical protein
MNIINIGGLATMDDNMALMMVIMNMKVHWPHGSSLSLITQNNDRNPANYKEGANIKLCDHATSLL